MYQKEFVLKELGTGKFYIMMKLNKTGANKIKASLKNYYFDIQLEKPGNMIEFFFFVNVSNSKHLQKKLKM